MCACLHEINLFIITGGTRDTKGTMDALGTRRLEVLKGHLLQQGDVKPSECSGVKSSAPISSSKAEVQRAFPRHRYAPVDVQ